MKKIKPLKNYSKEDIDLIIRIEPKATGIQFEGEKMNKAPAWFVSFEKRNDKRWEENNARWEENNTRWEENNARWDKNEKRLDKIEFRLNTIEKDIKDIKNTPTMKRELKK